MRRLLDAYLRDLNCVLFRQARQCVRFFLKGLERDILAASSFYFCHFYYKFHLLYLKAPTTRPSRVHTCGPACLSLPTALSSSALPPFF